MKKVVTLLTCSLLALVSIAQTKQISGVVVDEAGIEVIGASVQVKGSTQGTITDIDGKFVLDVDADAKALIVKYMGYQDQEVAIKGSNIRVVMVEDSKLIEEVVVTGYGNVSKGSFAGSAQSVTSENIEKKTPSEISKAMAGEVAGVQVINTSGQPGSSASIYIRGLGSIQGSRTPLIIVDGVTYNGTLASINPSDIASYTVLKDATATSLYGSRGANGVVVITTKKGKQDEDAKIDIEVTYGANMHLLPLYEVISDPQEYVEMSWQSLYNANNYSAQIASDNLFSAKGLPTMYQMWVIDNDAYSNNPNRANYYGRNLIDGEEFIVAGVPNPNFGKFRTDIPIRLKDQYKNLTSWEKAIFRTGQKANVTASISGGNQKISYFTSFNYLKDEGYYIGSDFDRFTTRSNIEFQAKKWLKGSINIAYTYSSLNNPGQGGNMNNGFAYVNGIPPIYPVYEYNEDGTVMLDSKTGSSKYDYGMHEGSGRGFGSGINPAGSLKYDKALTKRHMVSVNGMLEFKLYKELKLEVTVGTQYNGVNSSNLTNKYYGDAAGLGRIGKSQTNSTYFESKQLIKYNTTIDAHTIDVLAGHELSFSRASGMEGDMARIANPASLEWGNAIQMTGMYSSSNETALQSALAQANYTYDNRYMLTGNYRADGSSKFAKGKRWGHFGSVGAAWLFTNEKFMEPAEKILKNGKLRFSWGVLGNQGISSDLFQDQYNIEYVDGQVGYVWAYKGAPDITWERTQTYDAGIEFSLSKYADIEFDYFYKLTDHMLMPRYQATSMGYSSVWINGGEMSNQGVEFQVNVHAVDMRNVKLDIRLNGAHYKNKVLSLPKNIDDDSEMDVNGSIVAGHSLFDWRLREYVGVNPENGKAMYVGYYDSDKGGFGDTKNADLITEEDMATSGYINNYISDVYLYRLRHPNAHIDTVHTDNAAYCGADFVGKSASPALAGGFGIDLEVYGVTLNVTCSYGIGGYGYDNTYATLMGNEKVGNHNWHVDMRRAWTKQNPNTDVPALNNGNDPYTNSSSTRFLTSNSFLSLNNIRLGYSFQKKLIEKIKLSKLELYVQADNLAVASARKGYNPMVSLDGSSDGGYQYTPLSTIIGGIKIQF
ncbi:MAG: SusC/RagA family TonB-linked outer membrane protein [Paludibacteraceae bacterium]|nr:SusC/RagA family TonB-linked outer membrane protein [Paludibacteraceae bacterium]